MCRPIVEPLSMARYSFYSYQMAESIDAQLKRMTDDLKEVIDHLNTGTGAGDKNKEPVSFTGANLQSWGGVFQLENCEHF